MVLPSALPAKVAASRLPVSVEGRPGRTGQLARGSRQDPLGLGSRGHSQAKWGEFTWIYMKQHKYTCVCVVSHFSSLGLQCTCKKGVKDARQEGGRECHRCTLKWKWQALSNTCNIELK